jgi:hypothetical protein
VLLVVVTIHFVSYMKNAEIMGRVGGVELGGRMGKGIKRKSHSRFILICISFI